MDLQGTGEARTQEEGADGPLDTYGGANGRSNRSNRSNERRESHGHEAASNVRPHRRSPPAFEYPPGSGQTAVITERIPAPSREAITIPKALNLTAREERLARKARRNPPVTKKTLSELDLACIISNINLRMDANFDRDLHFKPDLGGAKGQRKRKESDEYWEAIATEIKTFSYNGRFFNEPMNSSEENPLRTFEPRLPAMFEALDDIIKTLVPARDHELVTDNLDVSLLMQQIRHATLDMASLSTWMATLLKTHCAPLRDRVADDMVELITRGQQEGDAEQIAEGLKTLFGLLETMKLDVANHQIRTFRELLIQDTVPFLKAYFQEKVASGDPGIMEACSEYRAVAARMQRQRANMPTNILGDGAEKYLFVWIGEIIAQLGTPEDFPATFVFDSERLWALRGSIQNLLSMHVAWTVLEEHVAKYGGGVEDLERAGITYETFWSRIWSLVAPNEDTMSRPSSLIYEGESDLRAGVNWLQNMSSVALEVARFASEALNRPKLHDEDLSSIEGELMWHLKGEKKQGEVEPEGLTVGGETKMVQRIRYFLREEIICTALEVADMIRTMSPLAMAEAENMWLHETNPHLTARMEDKDYHPLIKEEITRISVRLAHVGVLHWQVWGPILYH